MEQNKVLTIIIPTYDMEKYLCKCLDSLIVSDENMERLEVLVINDGSKDSSSAIGHEYESKYPQTFRVIDKENGNYGSCINRGLKEATGKYVKVLDADDYFVNEAFDNFVTYLTRTDVDLVINEYCIVDENDEIKEMYSFDLPQNRVFSLKDIPLPMIEWIWHHGITYQAQLLRSINYHQTEGISYTDDEWIFMPMVAVKTVSYYSCDMYHYLLGREGQTFDPRIMKSSFDKRVIVGLSMVKYYGKVKNNCSEASRYYMFEKLKKRIYVIYNFYLTKQYSKKGNESLKSLDLCILEYVPELAKQLSSKKNRFGFHFIDVWRKAGYENTLYLRYLQWKFKRKVRRGMDLRKMQMPTCLRRV